METEKIKKKIQIIEWPHGGKTTGEVYETSLVDNFRDMSGGGRTKETE